MQIQYYGTGNVELKINKNKTNNLLKMMDYAKELNHVK